MPETGMCQCSTSTFEESCGCTVLDNAAVKGNDRAALPGKATTTGGVRARRYEVSRSLRHYLRAKSQGHHTIDRLEERGVERGSAQRPSLREDVNGLSSIRRTLELFQRQHWDWGNFRETGWSAYYGLSRAHNYIYIYTILN